MGKSSKPIVCVIIFVCFLWAKCEAQLAPALYVFGDSTVDVGNNNNVKTYAKSNYAPYGVDYPGGAATGRASNGLLIPDLIALSLGLPCPPAIRLANLNVRYRKGFNYASSSAGILPESGFAGSLSLVDQVGLFKQTVEEYLPLQFNNHVDLNNHLSKSIFLVVIGVNDYALNYIRKAMQGSVFNSDAVASLLLGKLGDSLQEMYNLGARKFVVFNIEAVGCLPSMVKLLKPTNSKCVGTLNSLVMKFNEKLPSALQQLASKSPGSKFTVGKNYEHVMNLVEQPQRYGLKDASNPCCVVTQYGTCDETKKPCTDRNAHVFFDADHTTQAANMIMALNCFIGVGCQPMNIKQLLLS